MAPEVRRELPPFRQVAEDIKARIVSGELGEGDPVPSVRKISQEWRISNATATKVIATLQSEGLVRTIPGIGTVVSTLAGSGPRDRFIAMRVAGKIYPQNEYARIVAATVVPAPARVASALGLSEGSDAIRRERVTYRDDVPVETSVSWFDGALAATAPKLLESERIQGGTPAYIESVAGRTVVSGKELVDARAATSGEAAALGVGDGSPVRAGENWLFDQSGEVIEYGEYVSVPGRPAAYEYDLPA
ncbi:GntR family transcriptional regulator [Parafrankia irregularis]|uniref:GntR family transcriptional regulator n=1 Tax=Parafrankia irregularis TaxID=795642 RepID=A0A0S4R1L3_9ACTN|nr:MULTISPECIES: GntR family transcriptional regulator [Parafrankia]MBE3204377.1 GntR family transcriptional regulator [Parafrankia sp. CH37]CUU61100.1 GntR family transcriptional regulator [Parafrankia irregularis]